MCRMTASTATDRPSRAVVLKLMSNNFSDNWQHDGYGITDGLKIEKGLDYKLFDESVTSDLDRNRIIMAHMRAASPNTSLTANEAHPYKFASFVGQHNGAFKSKLGNYGSNVPNTDSWRTFSQFQERWQGKITVGNINDWLSRLYDNSQFVIFMLQDNKLTVIKNSDAREMWYVPFGNGYLMNTSKPNLEWVMRQFAGEFEANATILPLGNKAMYTFHAGSRKIDYVKLDYKLQPAPKVPIFTQLKIKFPILKKVI